jgi:hypothetical protein
MIFKKNLIFSLNLVYVLCMFFPFILQKEWVEMNVPLKNSLGCNLLFIGKLQPKYAVILRKSKQSF